MAHQNTPQVRQRANLTKKEHEALKTKLAEYGGVQLMALHTSISRQTIDRIRLTGRGDLKTIEKVREYLAKKQGEGVQASAV